MGLEFACDDRKRGQWWRYQVRYAHLLSPFPSPYQHRQLLQSKAATKVETDPVSGNSSGPKKIGSCFGACFGVSCSIG